MLIRKPAQAGMFYAGTKEELLGQIEECFRHEFGPGELPSIGKNKERKIIAMVCPHAGYMYSGPVASKAYYALAADGKPEVFIILGPNHTGYGSGVSIMTEGSWETPLGIASIDDKLANKIWRASNIIDIDDLAHRYEHSIEVQLPFLQYIYGDVKFVPIVMMLQDLETCKMVADAIAKSVSGLDVVVIASSDFTHYEAQSRAEKKDRIAIEAILKLDENEFYSVIERHNISICGYGPISVAILAAKKLGAKKAELLQYKTSGDITKDYSGVVGYSAIAIKKE